MLSPAQEADTESGMMRGPEWRNGGGDYEAEYRNGRVRRMGQSGVMGEDESVVILVMRTTGVRWSQQNTRTG